MSSYLAPLRDIRFALFDVIGAEALYQKLGIANAQRETMDAVLEEAAKFVEAGWNGLTAPEAMGGQDLPESLGAAAKEMIDAANLSWGNYPLLSHGATEALKNHGEAWQQEVFLRPIISGQWTGTMCLT